MMNILQPIKNFKYDLIAKNNLVQLENDLTAWFITKYNEMRREVKQVVLIDIEDAKHYLWKLIFNCSIRRDSTKTINNALKKLIEFHNFERPLVTTNGLIHLQRKS